MDDLPTSFEAILRALHDFDARFVIVGGIALNLHGGANVTYDMDVCFARDRDNTEAIAHALQPFHPRLRGIPAGLPLVFDAQMLRNAANITLETDLGPFDLLGEPAGVDTFDGLYERAAILEIGGMSVRIASLSDLLAMKRAANRPKDQIHITTIERLMKLEDKVGDS